ncbi:MAG: homoserine dehydrogenase, partial [Armatimonadota bacterium]
MSHTDAPVGVGIIGFGTVGQGTYTILRDNAPTIARQVGVPVEPRMVADIRAAELAGRVGPGVELVSDARQVLESPDVQIVCELIGGVGVAADIVRQALSAGKHVVTANKELLARQGPELLRLAEENGCDFYFEASVGGGIPIISPLRVGLAGNRVERILGIVNGTTNYIL